MNLKRVVVTGLGAITPLGNNVPDYWKALLDGVSGAAPVTHFDASKFKTQFACEVKGYDSSLFFDRKEVRKYDLYAQYALVCADEAIKDSDIEPERINVNRAGVIWGSGIGGLDTFLKEVADFVKGD